MGLERVAWLVFEDLRSWRCWCGLVCFGERGGLYWNVVSEVDSVNDGGDGYAYFIASKIFPKKYDIILLRAKNLEKCREPLGRGQVPGHVTYPGIVW